MKQLLIVLMLLTIVSCGKSTIEVEDSEQTISGETYSYVILQLEFIQQIKTLCEELNLLSDFNSFELYKQEVAVCTFDNLAVLDLGAIEEFSNTICDSPQTQQEIDTCAALKV